MKQPRTSARFILTGSTDENFYNHRDSDPEALGLFTKGVVGDERLTNSYLDFSR